MNQRSTSATVQVALIVLPDTAPAVLYSLQEIFATVGGAWEAMTGKPAGQVRMQPQLVAHTRDLFQCAMGTPVRADATFDSPDRYDLIIATDLLLEAETDPRGRWPKATGWIRRQYDQGALVASVCTGGLLLAEAGLLDGLEATTHWSITALFEQFYPGVKLTPEKVLALTGIEHRVITAGGASSWVELALYLIAHYCGAEEATRTSKVFLLGDRSDGQLPFATMTRPRHHSDAVIDRCQAWIANHYELANPVARMVAYSGLAERTFKRRFTAATGYTPIEYIQTLRIEEAKQLLESTDMATDHIGVEVGYEDPASFRRLFKRMTGVTPARYRLRFRTIRSS
ncbi:helix-turn-helix domain-containing protein [Marinobacterium sp. D7]|uniref:GlxA family transcriptional regulator n=1 Tax=Marinobacterium ramblicola TaxID=2849041 RepID=UPI001C2D98BE|nr:helix-turn-helix domain-containing protein [Marinobacterium ramblicola]MBV1789812.1 helix-turn-helix domain-containing protein [Marinobacterium ramblicola]